MNSVSKAQDFVSRRGNRRATAPPVQRRLARHLMPRPLPFSSGALRPLLLLRLLLLSLRSARCRLFRARLGLGLGLGPLVLLEQLLPGARRHNAVYPFPPPRMPSAQGSMNDSITKACEPLPFFFARKGFPA